MPQQAPPSQQRVEQINQRREALGGEIAEIKIRLQAAQAKGLEAQAELLARQVEILEALDLTYGQQLTALDGWMTLQAQQKRYQEEMGQLSAAGPAKTRISFLELDRVLEDLNEELNHKETLRAKRDLAQSALERAENDLKESLKEIEAAKTSSAEDGEGLKLAQLRRRLAEAVQQQRELELDNEELAKSGYQIHLDLLEKKAAFLKTRAVFSEADLQALRQALAQQKIELSRALARAQTQQLAAKGRLVRARDRLLGGKAEQQIVVEAEVEARRLAAEALLSRIENLTKEIEWVANQETVWQRRYQVFNGVLDRKQWNQWKSEATSQIDQIEKEQRLLPLWLSDWQNQAITLNNKIGTWKGEPSPQVQWLIVQQKSVQQIIAGLGELQTFLENTRRLNQRLAEEITARTARRTPREWMELIFDFEIYQNRVRDWAYAMAIGILGFILLLQIRRLTVNRLKRPAAKGSTSLANGFAASVEKTSTVFLLALALFIAMIFLKFDHRTSAILRNVIMVALILQAAIWISDFARAWIFRYLSAKTKQGEESRSALGVFNFVTQALVWSLALLLALQNLGVDITALVAGLGIGGVAIALALQRILGDLFSSLSIVLDKPFVTGDFIIFDDFMGVVEHIGIKTTRIRSLSGEQIICANSDLLNVRIRNYKRMRERRVLFPLGVVYQTPYEKLARIPALLREIIESQEWVRFDRAHFFQYGDFALSFEIVYYVLDSDYNRYMDIQQAINLEIFRRFDSEGIEFAYPTQSVYLNPLPGRPVAGAAPA